MKRLISSTPKVALISDLHIDSWEAQDITEFLEKLNSLDVDLIVSAGDTSNSWLLTNWFLREIQKPFFGIKGNHDYYGQKLEFCGHRTDDGKIVATTLWTSLKDQAVAQAFMTYLNDGKNIIGVTSQDVHRIHEISVVYLKQWMNSAKLIVTHHGPTRLSIHGKFKAYPDYINGLFANLNREMEDLVLDCPAPLWYHGHTHEEIDYTLEGTRVVCHPLGYKGERYKRMIDYEPLVITL